MQNAASKIEPAAGSVVSRMENSAGTGPNKLDDDASQIAVIRGTTNLVSNYTKFFLSLRESKNRVGEAFAGRSEEPGRF